MSLPDRPSSQSSRAPRAVAPTGANASPQAAGEAYPLELVSRLMDGELDGTDRRRCLDRLSGDERGRAAWAHWHAVGDCLRSSDVGALHSPQFTARLAQRLADEPAIVAPRALDTGVWVARRLALPGIAGVAAAVVLAVVAVPVLRDGATPEPVEIARVAGVSPMRVATVPVVPSIAQPPMSLSWPGVDRFHVYLSAHGQISGPIGMPRTSQYLRQGVIESDLPR